MAENSKSTAGTPDFKIVSENSGLDLADGIHSRRSGLRYLFFLNEVKKVSDFRVELALN